MGVGGVAMPTFWTGLLALYVFFYALGVAPPPLGRLATGITPPPRVTGLLTVDACWRWTAGRWAPPSTSWCCPRSCSASR